jgi:hypothetical protein
MERHQIECNICAETKNTNAFPSRQLTLGCLHPASTCFDCISASVNAQFETAPSTQISCPECPHHLGIDDARRYLTEENHARYVKHYKCSHEFNLHGITHIHTRYTQIQTTLHREHREEGLRLGLVPLRLWHVSGTQHCGKTADRAMPYLWSPFLLCPRGQVASRTHV